MKHLRKWLLCVIAAVSLTVTACEGDAAANASVAADVAHAAGNILGSLAEAAENSGAGNSSGQGNKTSMGMAGNPSATGEFRLSDIPEYTDSPYVAVNGNVPYFTEDDLTDVSFESYSDLDSLGRCGVAYASVSTDTMPTEKRGSIGEVKPTGWINAKYDFVDGKYLYNRCHLIGYQLTAENANEKNLITGTRYLNVQPGVTIDYATGKSELAKSGGAGGSQSGSASGTGKTSGTSSTGNNSSGAPGGTGKNDAGTSGKESGTYILNTKTMKFHRTDCNSVKNIKSENRKKYTGEREKLIDEGYEACKSCKP